MLLYVHLCNVDKIKYKTIEKDFYEIYIRVCCLKPIKILNGLLLTMGALMILMKL